MPSRKDRTIQTLHCVFAHSLTRLQHTSCRTDPSSHSRETRPCRKGQTSTPRCGSGGRGGGGGGRLAFGLELVTSFVACPIVEDLNSKSKEEEENRRRYGSLCFGLWSISVQYLTHKMDLHCQRALDSYCCIWKTVMRLDNWKSKWQIVLFARGKLLTYLLRLFAPWQSTSGPDSGLPSPAPSRSDPSLHFCLGVYTMWSWVFPSFSFPVDSRSEPAWHRRQASWGCGQTNPLSSQDPWVNWILSSTDPSCLYSLKG